MGYFFYKIILRASVIILGKGEKGFDERFLLE